MLLYAAELLSFRLAGRVRFREVCYDCHEGFGSLIRSNVWVTGLA